VLLPSADLPFVFFLKLPPVNITVKVRLPGNSSIGRVAVAAYFHRAHYNSRMALAAYFCHYLASHGISRAVLKVSDSSTGGTARTDQLTQRLGLVFIIAHIKIAYRRSPFSRTAESMYRHAPIPQACQINERLLYFRLKLQFNYYAVCVLTKWNAFITSRLLASKSLQSISDPSPLHILPPSCCAHEKLKNRNFLCNYKGSLPVKHYPF
jgi:hypothetical protein